MHVDKNDKNKSNISANDVQFCYEHDAEMQLMSQEKCVVCNDDNSKNDMNVSTLDKQSEEQDIT